jgi:ferric-dicitrate binding protein FerR (iron transport regulator)
MSNKENNNTEETWVSFISGESEMNPEPLIQENEAFRKLEKTWELTGLSYSYRNSDTDNAWSKLQGEMDAEPRIITLKRYSFLRYAAIFLALMALGSITFLTIRRTNHISDQVAYLGPKMISVQTLANPAELTTVVLPDGSTVKMNASSTLEYPEKFTAVNRTVKLSGEGFFDVIHDTAHPFVVQVKNMEIEDVGTSFNISAYPGKEKIEVNVTTGSVLLRDKEKKEEALLVAGTHGKMLTKNGRIEVFNELSPNYISWITKELSFHHTPLSTVFEELENIYHIKITFTDPEIADISYTANFEKFQIGDIVNVIAATHHLSVSTDADGFVFALK